MSILKWMKFKFVNCEIGNMGRLLMYLVFPITDLKKYFVPLASGSQSKPNTHDESANVMANQEEERVEGGMGMMEHPI